MIIGVPKEIMNHEARVSLVPATIRTLVEKGHKVVVETSAGEESGISDKEYIKVGATIGKSKADVYGEAEMIVKVKAPISQEYDLLGEGQILFSFLHLAPALDLTKALLRRKVIGIAYETVQLEDGSLPLLTPMSEITGKMSVQIGAYHLQKNNRGSGVLLGGVPGIKSGNVTIIGAGTVGSNAAKIALGMGANVTVIDINLEKLRYICDVMQGKITSLASNSTNIENAVVDSDLVIGAVLIPGFKSPRLITRDIVAKMKKGSVVVDVAIDQGGCTENSVPTTFDNPTFFVNGVCHYCVTNIPGAVSRTSTFALSNVTSPYILKIANLGYREALWTDTALRHGLNVFKGKLVYRPVAESLDLEYTPYENVN